MSTVRAINYSGKEVNVPRKGAKLSYAPDGKAFVIPGPQEKAKELERINKLAAEAKANGMQIVVVQGLGFVGAIMASIAARAQGKFVMGLQRPSPRSYWKIPYINSARTPVESEDPKVEQFIREAATSGKLTATFVDESIALADIVVSDVQCDVNKPDFGDSKTATVDIDAFVQATKTVAKHIRPHALYLVETTVPPGATEFIVKPIFEEEFRRRAEEKLESARKAKGTSARLEDIQEKEFQDWLRNPSRQARDKLIDLALKKHPPRIAHSYERVMPGKEYVDSVINFPRVYAGIDEASADMAAEFLSSVLTGPRVELTRLPTPTDSEFSKCAENTYRATVIALGRVLGRIAEIESVDLTKVVGAITKRPTHRNMLVPATPSTGGYCLPKDPIFLVWSLKNMPQFRQRLTGERLKELNSVLKLINLVVDINDTDGLHAVEILEEEFLALKKKLKGSRIVVAGASYREDVADTRYAPYEAIVRRLKERGAKISVVDPYIKALPELEHQDEDPYSMAKHFKGQKELKKLRASSDLSGALAQADAVIFAIPHQPYKGLTPADIMGSTKKRPDQLVILDCSTFDGHTFRQFEQAGFRMRKMYHGSVNA